MAGILYTLLTGDFPGFAFCGVEEDSAVITAALSLRGYFY